MIDPVVVVSVSVGFGITFGAFLLARRAPERTVDDRGEDAEQRYVNGGWH